MKNFEKERSKRLRLISSLAISLTIIIDFISLFWMNIYGISEYFAITFIIVSSSLGILGSAAIFTMFFGIYSALRPVEKDRFNPLNSMKDLDSTTKIAVLMPVYHEDPKRVCGALYAMIEEISQHEEKKHFDWFILSDSRHEDVVTQEQYCTFLLKEKFPDINIFYRHRIFNTAAKVGNTSDFFRRWGSHYKFCVIFDADSIMPASTMISMAKTIEGNEKIGIVQSISYEINSSTLYGRLRSFGFNTGIAIGFSAQYYFRMGRCSFYGHNAIVRSEAIMQNCNLPILEPKGPFAAGKPSSHDFFEAVLLEGAGYQTWLLPTLVSFDDQIQNIVDAMKRETRWIYGAMNWLRLFTFKNLSAFGKSNLLISCLHYFNTLTGLVFFLSSFMGTSYVLQHAFSTSIIIKKYNIVFLISFTLFIFSMTAPLTLYLIYFYKRGEIKKVGGVIKFSFSYFLSLMMNMVIAPMNMLLINLILFSWVKGKKMVWDSQNRGSRILTWREAFNNFWKLSVFGLAMLYYFGTHILPYATPKRLHSLNLQPFWLCFWVLIPILGLVFSPVMARFTSRSFPWMEQKGWLRHSFENEQDEYPVVKETKRMTEWFETRISPDLTFETALSDPYFSLRHLAQLPSRPRKYQFWKDKLSGRAVGDLSRLEKLVIFRCRELWAMFLVTQANRKTKG